MDQIQQALMEMASSLNRVIGVTDGQGIVLVASDEQLIGGQDPAVRALLASGDTLATAGNMTYRVTEQNDGNLAICFVEGTDDIARAYVELLSRWMMAEQCKSEERETRQIEHKAMFLKNVLLENELPGDIPLKAREFKIRYAERRVVLLLHFKPEEFKAVLETLEQQFSGRPDDYILPVDEENIVIMIEATDENIEGLDESLLALANILKESAMVDVKIGVSMTASNLTETAKAYQEASIALIVGEIFQGEEMSVMRYERLGLGRLIYQLPITLCELFLREVFEPGTYEALDPVTMGTINKFFENNLNGSETSRQLFVHRNTLVYRLDKVEKITGLDLRNFEDAVLFKLADMVRDYLAYVEDQKAKRQ
ncbi:MAG: helix-turn-helix domain-containing protein [Clostridiales bacterium]|jgi:carbohydrate diacid regulator|nr:helix-turn-helix domain-containing protein [Clostridiales bacterium]MDD3540027.1 helix-turn-helix domain-containing protein [Eubacteriales bacterium]MDY0119568.1 helix-turn-helix domain-containing protein [Clostridia bacterium]NLG30582.1 PucR family transcriptional regulator [Clostridiaceae bacterium]MCK9349975.1 helix-turn-helix domain-containing protein [Clostridiales bacterium]